MKKDLIINDVSQLNPVQVKNILKPTSTQEISIAVSTTTGSISIGGGKFSMGGQTSHTNSLHIDMRSFNQVIDFSPQKKLIRVQAGIRWCDIQKFIAPHNLAIKIMQTYVNFTVGGALSVNAHGRYSGEGPVILSVQSISIILSSGEIKEASPTLNAEIFYGAIGGYGGLGVITEVCLTLTNNTRVQRSNKRMAISNYVDHFDATVRESKKAVFHNGDIYPPHYSRVNAVTWSETTAPLTCKDTLMKPKRRYPFHQYIFWAISETPFGTNRREWIFDPLLFLKNPVVWRNYEAGYDVAELEPRSRKKDTFILQEYFIPKRHFIAFNEKMKSIFRRFKVNIINVSIRHAKQDPGSLLAWAKEEVFAFVVYYKQGTDTVSKTKVGVWTRELIDAALLFKGSYYLPYQPHATKDQFFKAFPKAKAYFALKKQLDPNYRFKNSLWEKYYKPIAAHNSDSEFKRVFMNSYWKDKIYLFLQNVFNVMPEDKFFSLIDTACDKFNTDQEIYTYVLNNLNKIKPIFADITYGLPALKHQKNIITEQTLALLNPEIKLNNILEIGSPGRYSSHLKKQVLISGNIYLLHDKEPTYSPVDIMERGGVRKLGRFIDLKNFDPIENSIPDNSLDLVTCYIGLHHTPKEKLKPFIDSIFRALKPNGSFIIRDHDAGGDDMKVFASLVHTVFNLGLGTSWLENNKEYKSFRSIKEWTQYLEDNGFKREGITLYQDFDPSNNGLMLFKKP